MSMREPKLQNRYIFDGREVAWGVVGSGPPVVAIHGTPWSSWNLRHVINALAAEYRLYYFDLLGYGCSDKRDGDVSLGVQNDLLATLLDHWRLDRPIVVGHDFGGAVALRTRLLNNRRFAALVLIDAVAVRPWGSEFFRHVQQHEQAFAGVPAYMHEAMVRSYVQTAAHHDIDPAVLERIVQPWLGEAGQRAFYRQIAQASQSYTDEVQPHYGEIDEPALVLWGAADSWIPSERGETLASALPDARFERIPDAGHLVIEERPEELVARIQPFLAELSRRGSAHSTNGDLRNDGLRNDG